jgi:hypothetical protein
VILFGFRAKLVKIVEQNRTEFISQIKKITNSEPAAPARGRAEGSRAAIPPAA